MKKNLLIIILSILMQPDLAAQTKTGIENYNFLKAGESYVWMPVVHHRGKKGLYTEMRYNYEELKTASVYMGKSFSSYGKTAYTITPMAGIVFGEYNGVSLATNIDMEHKNFFLSMQTQYTVSKGGEQDNFFFNWSEAGFQPLKWFYTGLSAQFTKPGKSSIEQELGLVAGFVINKITVPVYVFSPFNHNRNFIIGVNAEW